LVGKYPPSESVWLTTSPISLHSIGGSICRGQIGVGRWPPMRDSLTSTSVWLQHTHRFGYLWKLIGWVSTATPTSGMANDSLLLRRWSNRLSSCGLVTHSTPTVVGGSTEGLTPTDSLAKSGWLRGWLDTNSTPLLGGRIHADFLTMNCGIVRVAPREAWCLDGDSHQPTYHFRYDRREVSHTLGWPVGMSRRSPRSVVTHSQWVGSNLGVVSCGSTLTLTIGSAGNKSSEGSAQIIFYTNHYTFYPTNVV